MKLSIISKMTFLMTQVVIAVAIILPYSCLGSSPQMTERRKFEIAKSKSKTLRKIYRQQTKWSGRKEPWSASVVLYDPTILKQGDAIRITTKQWKDMDEQKRLKFDNLITGKDVTLIIEIEKGAIKEKGKLFMSPYALPDHATKVIIDDIDGLVKMIMPLFLLNHPNLREIAFEGFENIKTVHFHFLKGIRNLEIVDLYGLKNADDLLGYFLQDNKNLKVIYSQRAKKCFWTQGFTQKETEQFSKLIKTYEEYEG